MEVLGHTQKPQGQKDNDQSMGVTIPRTDFFLALFSFPGSKADTSDPYQLLMSQPEERKLLVAQCLLCLLLY